MCHAHKNRHTAAQNTVAQNTAALKTVAQNTVAQNTAAQNTAMKTVCFITLWIDRCSRSASSLGLYTRLDKPRLVCIKLSLFHIHECFRIGKKNCSIQVDLLTGSTAQNTINTYT